MKPEMNAFLNPRTSNTRSEESAIVQPKAEAGKALDLIDEISNATGHTANEVQAALLNLLPERTPNRRDSNKPAAES
jgi:hypothetical protein